MIGTVVAAYILLTGDMALNLMFLILIARRTLAAFDWQSHHAALIALAQIAEGCSKAHAASVVINFSENCNVDLLDPYMDDIMRKLVVLLQNTLRLSPITSAQPNDTNNVTSEDNNVLDAAIWSENQYNNGNLSEGADIEQDLFCTSDTEHNVSVRKTNGSTGSLTALALVAVSSQVLLALNFA
ncbi:Importin subunit beta-3 [Bienertia sinuspersici]